MSRRLQITLTDRQYALLEETANRTHVSMAEQIRTLVDRELQPAKRPFRSGLELILSRRPAEPIVGRRPGIRFVD